MLLLLLLTRRRWRLLMLWRATLLSLGHYCQRRLDVWRLLRLPLLGWHGRPEGVVDWPPCRQACGLGGLLTWWRLLRWRRQRWGHLGRRAAGHTRLRSSPSMRRRLLRRWRAAVRSLLPCFLHSVVPPLLLLPQLPPARLPLLLRRRAARAGVRPRKRDRPVLLRLAGQSVPLVARARARRWVCI